MRYLIPFDYATLGGAELLWLGFYFVGLSMAAPRGRRVGAAIWTGVILLLVGLLREAMQPATVVLSAAGGEASAIPGVDAGFNSLVLVPLVGALTVLGARLRWPAYGWGVWSATWLLVIATTRPFGRGLLDAVPETLFLAIVWVAAAAMLGGPGRLRAFLFQKRLGPFNLRDVLVVALVALCAAAHPFGWGPIHAVVLLLTGWVFFAVISQGREMRRYVYRRLIGTPIVLLLLLTVSFFLVRAAPGGPFDKEKRVAPEIAEMVKAKYGHDKPLAVQYLKFMGDLVWDGNLGPSFKQLGRTVNEIIKEHIGPSAVLGLAALMLALLIGISAGLISGLKQNSFFDYASMTGATIGLALPTFIVGPMLVLLFAMRLDWFNVTGWDVFPRDLILPTITLALPFAARVARLTRAGMLEVVNQDYIRTARAKGLSEPVIVMRHTLKGTLLPVVSYLGPAVSQMLVGWLVVETIFGVPGIGREFVQSALNRDYGMALGLVLMFGTLLIVMNLIVDVAYAFLDPRIRHA